MRRQLHVIAVFLGQASHLILGLAPFITNWSIKGGITFGLTWRVGGRGPAKRGCRLRYIEAEVGEEKEGISGEVDVNFAINKGFTSAIRQAIRA